MQIPYTDRIQLSTAPLVVPSTYARIRYRNIDKEIRPFSSKPSCKTDFSRWAVYAPYSSPFWKLGFLLDWSVSNLYPMGFVKLVCKTFFFYSLADYPQSVNRKLETSLLHQSGKLFFIESIVSLLIFLFTLCAKIPNLDWIRYFPTDCHQSVNGKETQINYFIEIKLMKLPVDHIHKTNPM